MSRLKTRTGRGLAGGLAAALLAAGVGTLPALPASAAPATGSLSWGISQNYVEHLFFSKMGPMPETPTGTLSGGVTHDAGDPATGADDLFNFPATGSSTAADGTVTSTFEGTVRGAFVAFGTERYSVTLSDPTLVVSPTGEGELKATVSGEVPGDDPVVTAPTEVTVAEFTGATTAAGVTTVTPNWAGVLAPGSQQATDLGIEDPTRPVDGKSFHPDFLGAIPAGVRAHFYFTSSGDHKRPGDLSSSAVMVPTVTPTVTAVSYTDGVTIQVGGEGFTAVTNPGDAGVYVGLAPADTIVDFGDRDATSVFAAIDWVMPSRFDGDGFTTVLSAATDKLVSGEDYAIFTWQAHTHSNTTQDTVTPVAIDWTELQAPAPEKIKPKVTRKLVKPKRTKKGKLTVRVAGERGAATGRVVVKVKRGKKTIKTVLAKLNKRGKKVVRLPKGKRGAYRAIVQYRGDANYKKARKVFKYRIR